MDRSQKFPTADDFHQSLEANEIIETIGVVNESITAICKIPNFSSSADAQAFAEQALPNFIQELSKRKSLSDRIRNAVTAVIPQFFNLPAHWS
jgi:hypothetical protein